MIAAALNNYGFRYQRPSHRGSPQPDHYRSLKTPSPGPALTVDFRHNALRLRNRRTSRHYNRDLAPRERYATDYVVTDPGQNFKMPHIGEMHEARRAKIAAQNPGKKPPAPIQAKTAPTPAAAKTGGVGSSTRPTPSPFSSNGAHRKKRDLFSFPEPG
jgi:hypothetical protein